MKNVISFVRVKYLGHYIIPYGLEVDPDKVPMIKAIPSQKMLKVASLSYKPVVDIEDLYKILLII